MLKNKKLFLALSVLPIYALVKVLANFPDFVDRFYSNGLYPVISKLFRFTLGWLPFSFGDLLYSFGLIFIIRWLILNRKRIYKDTKNWLIDVLGAISVIYIAFHLFWGLNYYRNPLHVNLNLQDDYTTEQLVNVTKKLIKKSNAIHLQITKLDTIKVVFPFTKTEILQQTQDSYQTLESTFPDLKYKPKSLKKSLLSVPLTYMGFSGYLNPLTNEAQVDYLIPAYKFPTTAAHEVAHQLGYAKENEANFIGFMATVSNDNIYFKYSGYTFGLRYCLNEIYRRNPDLYKSILPTINKGILKNYQESQDFWKAYKNPFEPIFKSTYTSYLKANNQVKGMDSYSYVVALLVNYLENKAL